MRKPSGRRQSCKRPLLRSQRGGSFIEMMVAGLLLSIGMMAMVSTWTFSFRVTTNTDNSVIAYNLGRQAIEVLKRNVFPLPQEGTTTAYYDGNQTSVSSTSPSRVFSVTTAVVSDSMKSGSAGVAGGVPADYSLRHVTVDVILLQTGTTLYHTETNLTRAGI